VLEKFRVRILVGTSTTVTVICPNFLNISHLLYSPPLALSSDFFSLMIILQTVGLLRLVISSSQGLYLNTGEHKHRINTYTYQKFILFVGFEPTIPASEQAKTAHALGCSATVIGYFLNLPSANIGLVA
jgi:hypothetical protein